MNEDQLLKRITSNPKIMVGKPVTKGTVENLVRVPNNQRHDEHLLKLNHYAPDNLHEYDVLIFEMGVEKEEDFGEKSFNLDNVTGQTAYALLSAFPEKIFNPKPYATKILSETINELLKKESLIIIFAGRKEKIEYQFVKITSDGYTRAGKEEVYNTCFYDSFPQCFNKIGTKFYLQIKQLYWPNFFLSI